MRFLFFLAVVLVAAVIAPASVATPPDTFAAPGLRVTPPILNFGAVARGETRERTLSVTNVGSEPADFSVIGVSAGFPLFTWDFFNFLDTCPLTGPGAGVLLLPGETCKLTVIAAPDSSTLPGRYEGQFRFGTSTQAAVLVPLRVIVRG
jgi:hypothetical protein